MTKRSLTGLLALACLAVTFGAARAERIETSGRIDAVTVFRGQAMITRLVDTPKTVGLHEIIVTDLPPAIQPSGLYAESADGAAVRSVRYRVRPISTDVREEVRQLDEQLRALHDQVNAFKARVQLHQQHRTYLDKLEQFAAPTANLELTRGVLNSKTLEELTKFLFDTRRSLMEADQELGLKQRDLQEQLELLHRQRAQITGSSSKLAREAVVFVDIKKVGASPLRLRYLVNEATWTPSYNIRAGADRTKVMVEYLGSIRQTSGESWDDVVMTLSTATPSLIAKAPKLEPLSIHLGSIASAPQSGLPMPQSREYFAKRVSQLKEEQSRENKLRNELRGVGQVAQQSNRAAAPNGAFDSPVELGLEFAQFDDKLNQLACDLQKLELSSGAAIKHDRNDKSIHFDEGVAVTYKIDGRTALPSRNDQQLIQIASLPLDAGFYKLATPVLTSYVYDQADVSNTSGRVLLAGPASTYVAGEFVGHDQIPTVAIGEQFTVGLGIDSSLRAVRELLDRKESIQGGNRVVKFTYRLAIENFGSLPVDVRVLDRLPQAHNGQVKLTFAGEFENQLSRDENYQQADRKKNILRWDMTAPAQATGVKALNVDYEFGLEYDKQMTITELASRS